MNFDEAIKILELPANFDERALKKAYYKKALLYHPDKNNDDKSTDIFKQVGAAYQFLRDKKNLSKEVFPSNFKDLIKKCVKFMHSENKWENIFINTTLHSLLNYKEISLKVFEKLHKVRGVEVYDFLSEHKDIFSVSDEILAKMKATIERKMSMDNIVILNPHLEDMMSDTIYKLEMGDKIFYIPLWHNELWYDASGRDMVVKCIPELKKGITMDNENNLYYIHHEEIGKVLQAQKLTFTLGGKVFEIPAKELKILPRQVYIFYGRGIACVDDDNMYNIKKRGNIYVEINLSLINMVKFSSGQPSS
jgi:hypothetical protein